MDDGNRQLSISASLALNPEQFEALDLKLGGIHGAVDKLTENISEPDTSVAAEISLLRNEVGMRLTTLDQSIILLTQSITLMDQNLGKWLGAIALAVSTPEDNSAEVQQQIDKHAAEIRVARQTLQSSIDRNQPKGEIE